MIEEKQARRDREAAPVLARCPGCGGEIYQRAETALFGGVCADCARAARIRAALRPGPRRYAARNPGARPPGAPRQGVRRPRSSRSGAPRHAAPSPGTKTKGECP